MSKTIGAKEAAMRAMREARAAQIDASRKVPILAPRPPARTLAVSPAAAIAKLTADIARVTEAGKPKVSDTKPKPRNTPRNTSADAKKEAIITFRADPEFRDWLRKRAEEEGLTVGAYIRRELGP